MKGHEIVEKNIGLMTVFVVIAISFGGLVEIVPQFFLKQTTTPIEGLKPLNAVQLEGRDVYIREGCHVCHTQMVRPLRAEVERYGHYSVAGESVYEHPFLWGSKRTGPDLHRIGGKYSDDWHRLHLLDPRSVVPRSIMPAYPWLAERDVKTTDIQAKLTALRALGHPYEQADIDTAQQQIAGMKEIDAIFADEKRVLLRLAAALRRRSQPQLGDHVVRPHLAGDQPRAALVGEVRVGPLEQHAHAVPEPREIHDVKEEPEPPREVPPHAKPGELRHRLVASDRGETGVSQDMDHWHVDLRSWFTRHDVCERFLYRLARDHAYHPWIG